MPVTQHIVALHGIEGHPGWLGTLADALSRDGIAMTCIPREPRGDSDGIDAWLAQVARAVANARREADAVILLGHSWGARLAVLADVSVDAIVLVAPGLYRQPAIDRVPITDEAFSDDVTLQAFVRDDPKRLRAISARFALDDRHLQRRIEAMDQLAPPLYLALADRDRIVDNDATLTWQRRVAPAAAVARFDAGHLFILEQPRALAARVSAWLRKRIAP